jgi:hypothetical protein
MRGCPPIRLPASAQTRTSAAYRGALFGSDPQGFDTLSVRKCDIGSNRELMPCPLMAGGENAAGNTAGDLKKPFHERAAAAGTPKAPTRHLIPISAWPARDTTTRRNGTPPTPHMHGPDVFFYGLCAFGPEDVACFPAAKLHRNRFPRVRCCRFSEGRRRIGKPVQFRHCPRNGNEGQAAANNHWEEDPGKVPRPGERPFQVRKPALRQHQTADGGWGLWERAGDPRALSGFLASSA